MKKTTGTSSGWDHPEPTAEFLAKHPAQDVEIWRKLISRVIDVATANGWTKTVTARRTDIAEGTFSQWASGKYLGILVNQNNQVSNWLTALADSEGLASRVPVSPTFQQTLVGREILETLAYAQVTAGFVAITLDAGVGKTTAARHFCKTRPHAYLATISPNTKTVHGMLVELASELDVLEHNPARLVRAIGRKLQRNGDGSILIIDEAQNLVAEAINQLRHFVDINKCGVALLGNEATASDFMKEQSRSVSSRAQVLSRFDKRLKREPSRADDARTLIEAWDVQDEDMIRFLLGIAMKPGALRQIDRTMKLATMVAIGDGDDVTLKHLQMAWKNRDLGDIA